MVDERGSEGEAQRPRGWRQYAFGILFILVLAAVYYFWRRAG